MNVISADFKQNKILPYHREQPGELYFHSGQKVAIYGIVEERAHQQINYLIDEKTISISKDSNGIHSLQYNYLIEL